jgi:hypothetical protein
MRDELLSFAAILAIGFFLFLVADGAMTHRAEASTQASGYKWERELGAQKLTPTVSTALTIPAGTTHAELYVEGGDMLVRWNGGAPVDSATGAMKWPSGHFRKEANDGPKLSGFRALCADCTLWVNYFGDRRVGQ